MKNAYMREVGGFTLIELLVVVLIIGILAAVAVPQYQKAVEKSRAVQGIALVKSLADAQKVFLMANGKYTNNLEDLDISLPGNPTGSSQQVGDFVVKLDSMTGAIPHIQAQYNKAGNLGTWYIVQYMNRGKIDCVSCGNAHGDSICKTFNANPETCPEASCKCYSIQ